MKITRIDARSIVLIWALVILLLGTVLMIGFFRNMADLRQLMADEANQLIEVVDVSARASIHSLDKVEDLTARRLLDNARLAASSPLNREGLERLLRENDIAALEILDSAGNRVVSLGNPAVRDTTLLGDAERRVLGGYADEELIGFRESGYRGGQLFCAVVKRPGGGAVVVAVQALEMLEFRKAIGLGTLFGDMGNREGVRYIVLQDTLGIVAASRNVTEMNRISDDPFLGEASSGGNFTRHFESAGGPVFEIVKPLVVDGVDLGLLRIGLDTGVIEAIRSRAVRQFLVLFLASALSGAFLFIFLMLRQNYRMLNREHDRMLRNVRSMEEQARRSERLASMGKLAGGVAHEIRNPLNAISIIAQRLAAEFTPSEGAGEYRQFLKTIGTEIDRIRLIVDHFLAYLRPPDLRLETVDIAALARESARVIEEPARAAGIDLRVEAEPGLTCFCDSNQMKQVFLNLLLNAVDAVHADGEVGIRAGRYDSRVEITVTDTGPGIPREIRKHVFDPYFTTKDHGSGLGLSEVHRIVSAHGGSVAVENGETGGAVFTISLPVTGGLA